MNIDANPFHKIDMWLDVRHGLPFSSGVIESVHSTHTFEHFYPDELERVLRECFRVLKPGGGIRLVVPNLASAITAYAQKKHDWFYDEFPRHFDSLVRAILEFRFLRRTASNRIRRQLSG